MDDIRPCAAAPRGNKGQLAAGRELHFCVMNGEHVPRLNALAGGGPTLVELTAALLTDGPWCPNALTPNRFDADLLRIRQIRVTVRVQSALAIAQRPGGRAVSQGRNGESGRALCPRSRSAVRLFTAEHEFRTMKRPKPEARSEVRSRDRHRPCAPGDDVLSALGMALALTSPSERQVAATYGWGTEVFYGADSAFERALQDLSLVPDWNLVLNGGTSTFVDGSAGSRACPMGRRESATGNRRGELRPVAVQSGRYAGDDRYAAMGREQPCLAALRVWAARRSESSGAIDSNVYVVVWVADDSLRPTASPLIDGDTTDGPNPGAGAA